MDNMYNLGKKAAEEGANLQKQTLETMHPDFQRGFKNTKKPKSGSNLVVLTPKKVKPPVIAEFNITMTDCEFIADSYEYRVLRLGKMQQLRSQLCEELLKREPSSFKLAKKEFNKMFNTLIK